MFWFVAASLALCTVTLVVCIMITASRASREEERRAIDKPVPSNYGGWNHTVEHTNAPESRRPAK